MKVFYEQEMLDKYWINQYCFGNHKVCVRFEMEETEKPHLDNMLSRNPIYLSFTSKHKIEARMLCVRFAIN